MTTYIALLRAVNVGGTGKLPMSDLTAMCEDLGFGQVKTFIASGNVVFTSKLADAKVKATLEARLATYAGKPVGVMVRTAKEMAGVLADNPFRQPLLIAGQRQLRRRVAGNVAHPLAEPEQALYGRQRPSA